ncbi:MAG: VWA domain-containing protein [Terriglobia bacterium]|nr:VWA domain-containing protein [Terriglobia bacterium]
MRRIAGVLLSFVFAASLAAQTNSELAEFRAAAAKPDAAQRVSALAQFLAGHPQTSLNLDALELLVWNSRTGASLADLEHWTSQLLSASPQNPLAAAVILGDSLPIAKPEAPAGRAKGAITALDHFDRPEGMSHDDFAAMKNYVVATLNGVVGYSYFEQKDFSAALPYLRKSVTLFPDNAQLVYTLALSDLQGSREYQAEGFRYLARSVNLTRGTPAGETLATFAQQKYVDAGGTTADWNKYLAAEPVPPRVTTSEPVETARAGTAHPANAAISPARSSAAPSSTMTGSNPQPRTGAVGSSAAPARADTANPASTRSNAAAITPSATSTATGPQPRSSAPANSTPVATAANHPATSAPSATLPPSKVAAARANATTEVAMATPPPPPPPSKPAYPIVPPRHIPALVKGAPMSIGLLIQSALAQKGTRQPLVSDLTDMVRRLHPYDEAFVMSFSKGMVFQEDLTSDDKALESAMDSIAPEQGSAIYDAVTFAAGHLNRIARNPNRVLIVFATQGDRSSEVSPLELSSELNVSGVRIYCIGLDVASPSDQARLQQLAAYTGGRAYFVNGTAAIRSAIRSISGDLGILYPN